MEATAHSDVDTAALRERVADVLHDTIRDTAPEEPGRYIADVHAHDLADAVLAVVDDEAIDRMAQHYVDDTRIRAMEFRNGAEMKLKPAQDMAAMWVAAAKTMLGDAENYTETEVGLPSVSMDVKLAGEYEMFTLTVQRARKLTPHQARQRAEEQRDDARALAKALFEVVREFVGDWDDTLDPELTWETLPGWLVDDNEGRLLWGGGVDV